MKFKVPGCTDRCRETFNLSEAECDQLRYPQSHAFWFHIDTLRYMVEKAGFEVEQLNYGQDAWSQLFQLDGREYLATIARKPI